MLDKKPSFSDTCNVAYAMELLGGKWKVSIIWDIARYSPVRTSALRRRLIGISEGVLIMQLKALERDHIIRRIDHHEVPPRVEYELTPLGESLVGVVEQLHKWGGEHREAQGRIPPAVQKSPSGL